jgi:hypothetical protein
VPSSSASATWSPSSALEETACSPLPSISTTGPVRWPPASGDGGEAGLMLAGAQVVLALETRTGVRLARATLPWYRIGPPERRRLFEFCNNRSVIS